MCTARIHFEFMALSLGEIYQIGHHSLCWSNWRRLHGRLEKEDSTHTCGLHTYKHTYKQATLRHGNRNVTDPTRSTHRVPAPTFCGQYLVADFLWGVCLFVYRCFKEPCSMFSLINIYVFFVCVECLSFLAAAWATDNAHCSTRWNKIHHEIS